MIARQGESHIHNPFLQPNQFFPHLSHFLAESKVFLLSSNLP